MSVSCSSISAALTVSRISSVVWSWTNYVLVVLIAEDTIIDILKKRIQAIVVVVLEWQFHFVGLLSQLFLTTIMLCYQNEHTDIAHWPEWSAEMEFLHHFRCMPSYSMSMYVCVSGYVCFAVWLDLCYTDHLKVWLFKACIHLSFLEDHFEATRVCTHEDCHELNCFELKRNIMVSTSVLKYKQQAMGSSLTKTVCCRLESSATGSSPANSSPPWFSWYSRCNKHGQLYSDALNIKNTVGLPNCCIIVNTSFFCWIKYSVKFRIDLRNKLHSILFSLNCQSFKLARVSLVVLPVDLNIRYASYPPRCFISA